MHDRQSSHALSVGDAVSHAHLGRGTVVGRERSHDETRGQVDVDFDERGVAAVNVADIILVLAADVGRE